MGSNANDKYLSHDFSVLFQKAFDNFVRAKTKTDPTMNRGQLRMAFIRACDHEGIFNGLEEEIIDNCGSLSIPTVLPSGEIRWSWAGVSENNCSEYVY